MEKDKLTVLDLFSGCGGLSEGFLQTGKYEFLAHIEWEKPMVDTLRENLIKRWNYTPEQAKKAVLRFDIQKLGELLFGFLNKEIKDIYKKDNDKAFVEKGLNGIIKKKVDVIIGGPPCQAYSIAGRAQDPNSMKLDYRNYLFESFAALVYFFKPKVFVFENVPGMLSAKPGDKLVIDRIIKAFKKQGYIIRNKNDIKKAIYSSQDFNVPQVRKRVIIYGVKKEYANTLEEFYKALDEEKSKGKIKTVQDAIKDLPKFKPLKEPYKKGNRNYSHQVIGENKYEYHNCRYSNLRDIGVFKKWLENSMNNMSNDEKIKFYKQVSGKDTNHNKYRSLEWDKPSPTIVSHLYKDGLMFIHPDIEQLRTITILEAALLQSFPIDYIFKGSPASAYKMIGNAVPVEMAKSIANSIYKVLKRGEECEN